MSPQSLEQVNYSNNGIGVFLWNYICVLNSIRSQGPAPHGPVLTLANISDPQFVVNTQTLKSVKVEIGNEE